jgi:putative peptide zinc metalloprotease protein
MALGRAWSNRDVLELVLPDRRRIALVDEHTIGRSPRSTVRLVDPSVSRVHARIRPDGDGALLSDVGSTYGTFLDGRRVRGTARLRVGSLIRVGDQELTVDRARGADEAGDTVVVPSVLTTAAGPHPRLRSGHALKRLAAAEGERRWMLKDLRSGEFVRLSVADAELLSLLDGTRSLAELVAEAARRQGADGPARLALLIAGLGERGLLSGVSGSDRSQVRGWRRVLAPRTLAWAGAGALFSRVYAAGGRLVLTRVGVSGLAALVLAGVVAFAVLVVGRYGTPFVVASKVGLGGVVFVLGRLLVAAVHETAHGLVMASFGRPVREAGLKFVLVFPYAYVDTSDAWFEPRSRRVAVSAAGPASDLVLGGAFALGCLAANAGPLRDVFFQLACGAYVGAFFNLNPLVPRDGYQIAVDVLSPRGLRRARVTWAVGGVALAVALFAHWVL